MDKCPNCGAEINSSDKRCSKCGNELKKSNNKLLIGIVAVIVVIAIAGIFASGMFLQNSHDTNTVGSQDNGGVVENSTSDSQDTSSSDGQEYWASSQSDVFHYPSCEWAQRIKGSNKIVFHSRDEAIASGRHPCNVCNP